MTWFRQKPPRTGDPAPRSAEPSLDTVGNPIVQRSLGSTDTRYPAPTRAEHRVLEFVMEGRVALPPDAPRPSAGAGRYWVIDGALATGTKAMMLDWLLEQGFIEQARGARMSSTFVLTTRGAELVAQRRAGS